MSDLRIRIAKKVQFAYGFVDWEVETNDGKERAKRTADNIFRDPDIKEAFELLELKRQGKIMKVVNRGEAKFQKTSIKIEREAKHE